MAKMVGLKGTGTVNSYLAVNGVLIVCEGGRMQCQ